MLCQDISMGVDTLVSKSVNVHFDSAWEFYKFLLSVSTGFLFFMMFWFLSTEQNFLHVAGALACGYIFYIKSQENVSDEESVTSQAAFVPQKRRARRDGDNNIQPLLTETSDETTESIPPILTDTSDETKSSSSASLLKDPPLVLEPLVKSRRQKKKRNSKSNKSKYKGMMDDSSETSSINDSYPRINTHVEKTKVYTPLPQYLELKMEEYAFYHEFKPFILTLDQLQRYGFPRESPDHPGRITTDPKLKRGSTKRFCVRCHKTFYVLADGRYESDSNCQFHPQKQQKYQNDRVYSGEFPCCHGNFMSQGCTTWQYHVSAESFLHDVEFVKSRFKRHLNEVTASTIYALDCEMLYTTAGMEVAKVGVVGVDGLTIFESYVLPQNQILDYNTRYSGVSEKDLKNVVTTLVDVQTFLLKLLNKDSILVGHGLENDLKALRLIHEKIVDTSVVFPHSHSTLHRKSLKVLAKELLSKNIQQSANGHDCIEDARTCMEIMLCKISSDLQTRLPVTADENKNIIPPMHQPRPHPQPQAVPVLNPFAYSYNSYYGESFGDNYYSGYLIPKAFYQRSCVY